MLKQGVEVTLSRGLEQWLWFLGLDVRHPSGNLLVKYGLKKFKSPNNKGSSRYQSEQNGDLIDLPVSLSVFIQIHQMVSYLFAPVIAAFYIPLSIHHGLGTILKSICLHRKRKN